MADMQKPVVKEDDLVEPKGKSVGQLMWIKFKRNPLARVGIVVLAILYFFTFLCEFFSPHSIADVYEDAMDHPEAQDETRVSDGHNERPGGALVQDAEPRAGCQAHLGQAMLEPSAAVDRDELNLVSDRRKRQRHRWATRCVIRRVVVYLI